MTMAMGSYASRVVATKVVATDGTGDYSDIQTAIDALPTGGGVVYVKEGTYTITSTIAIEKSNVALMGAGAATIVTCGTNFNDELLEIGDASTSFTGIIVESMKFDGNSANQSAGEELIVITAQASDSRIFGCWLEDSDKTGITIQANSARNHVFSNVIKDCALDGISASGANGGTVIQGNFIYDNGDSGIFTTGTGGYTTIAENVCVTNGEDGIECTGDINLIQGNYCSSNSENGIYITTDRNVIAANTCRLNKFHGLLLSSASYNTITGNVFWNNSDTNDNTYDDIHLQTTSTYNVITNNVMRADDATDQTKYGYREAAAADDYNIVVGNIAQGQQTATISTQGANTEVGHNIA